MLALTLPTYVQSVICHFENPLHHITLRSQHLFLLTTFSERKKLFPSPFSRTTSFNSNLLYQLCNMIYFSSPHLFSFPTILPRVFLPSFISLFFYHVHHVFYCYLLHLQCSKNTSRLNSLLFSSMSFVSHFTFIFTMSQPLLFPQFSTCFPYFISLQTRSLLHYSSFSHIFSPYF